MYPVSPQPRPSDFSTALPLTSPPPQNNNRIKSLESIISCLALGTSGVLWQKSAAGVHTDACLPVSLALRSQIIPEVIAGSKK